MPDPNQATAAGGAFKGNRMGKRGTSAKIQAISGSIQRISLSFAGGPVAVRVSGDPDPANNGLFHIYADHLGSTGSLSSSSGAYIPNSHAKYTPFGDWRTEPSATAGDRYYTNHKHNNLGGGADDLGLIYMNARYYLPGVGRFASADTIVPNPDNPQTINRFSYVNNRVLTYTDPSGHCAETGDEECWAEWDKIYAQMYDENDESIWGMSEFWEHLGTKSQVQLKNIYQQLKDGEINRALRNIGIVPQDGEPDYGIFEVSFGIWVVGINGDIIKDKYGNWYVGVGLNVGKSAPTFLTGRIAGGYFDTEKEPVEVRVQEGMNGLAVNIGGGAGGGGAISIGKEVSGEYGAYSPQIGISATYNMQVYDDSSSTPWFFQ